MSEWKLWDGDEPPIFTQPGFFEAHPRIAGSHQVGYYERLALVKEMVLFAWRTLAGKIASISDLGCGDGSLLDMLRRDPSEIRRVKMWGYDLGRSNVKHAQSLGLDVQQRDLLDDNIIVGELALVTEVLEHMVDPHRYLRTLRSNLLIATSPAAETDQWHYEHHAWAWDQDGFRAMIRGAGWHIVNSYWCVARSTTRFPPSGEERAPEFQCVFASRADVI